MLVRLVWITGSFLGSELTFLNNIAVEIQFGINKLTPLTINLVGGVF